MGRLILRILLALLFVMAGVVHVRSPRLFLPIMPPWVPAPLPCVIVSGACEILGGVGLLAPVRAVTLAAGWGLLALLLAVFPANIYMAAANIRVHGFPPSPWMNWARLPLQPIIMLAVIYASRIWPAPKP